MTTYVYIFEDGAIKQSPTLPCKVDLSAVADGVLTILRVDPDSAREYNSDFDMWVVLGNLQPDDQFL